MLCASLAIERLRRLGASGPVLLVTTAVLLGNGCGEAAQPVRKPSLAAGSASGTFDFDQVAQDVESTYIIGPSASRQIDYRITWQATIRPTENAGLKKLAVTDDAVFVIDGRNFLHRIRRDNGNRVWRIPVADPVDEILGITYQSPSDRVLLTVGSRVLVLDGATGSQIAKQKLDQIANTAPVQVNSFLVYGSLSGQLVWFAPSAGAQYQSYQISHSINIAPVYTEGRLVTVGGNGRLMVLDARSARQVWSRRLLDDIVAAPAAGNGAVYVAGRDHYIWAFDLNANRPPLWRYLTESALTESPVLIGDRVYQQVPSEGLLCFEAAPLDAPGGRVVWRSTETPGSVITRHRDQLLTWDGAARTLTVVDDQLGGRKQTVRVPDVDHLVCTDLQEGELIAACNDGRILRLLPRN